MTSPAVLFCSWSVDSCDCLPDPPAARSEDSWQQTQTWNCECRTVSRHCRHGPDEGAPEEEGGGGRPGQQTCSNNVGIFKNHSAGLLMSEYPAITRRYPQPRPRGSQRCPAGGEAWADLAAPAGPPPSTPTATGALSGYRSNIIYVSNNLTKFLKFQTTSQTDSGKSEQGKSKRFDNYHSD